MTNASTPGRSARKNHLAGEKSPYLLQHAGNPVDWYPWGEEAFARAEKEGRPIFLSIGYATCHWCHVMERESFADETVARLMNETFINIKVDREERPDIDQVYMTVCQMMTGSGGWPLTIIMTPDRQPFFAATYIPRESRFGRTGMLELVPRVLELWTTDRDRAYASAQQILDHLRQQDGPQAPGTLDAAAVGAAFEQLAARYDPVHGGFGAAPKFPSPHNLLFLTRYWRTTGNPRALEMVEHTLERMRLGGIYDQVGFGFHRYSTDAEWLVPHFEKMLYDQAMLLAAYTEGWQATANPLFERTVREIVTYVLRDMTSPEGPFFSAEDADSEGEEGRFYLWTTEEARQVLGVQDAALAADLWNMSAEGNFTDEIVGGRTGRNILHRGTSVRGSSDTSSLPGDLFAGRAENIREQLFAVRERRVHPLKDDKVLTDWNGLMAAALARAGNVFGEPEWIRAAERAVAFLTDNMMTASGRLLHRYR
ncbi:MAG: thioredoxin domain-containing protein, partial [Acidobacteriota bacterium]